MQLRDPYGGVRWDFSDGLLPRGINPMDIDLAYEAGNGYFLFLEGKRPGGDVPTGQLKFLQRLSQMPRCTVYVFEGEPPADIQRYRRIRGFSFEEWKYTDTSLFCGLIQEWFEWAEAKEAG